MMGMAGYGKPKYFNLIKNFINVSENGTFYLTNKKILNVQDQNKPLYTNEFLELLGKSRVPESQFNCNDSNKEVRKKILYIFLILQQVYRKQQNIGYLK